VEGVGIPILNWLESAEDQEEGSKDKDSDVNELLYLRLGNQTQVTQSWEHKHQWRAKEGPC